MRNIFCETLQAASTQKDFVFLTGDLGYKALEPLRESLGPRFINAGVAEQNMVGVAAGLARAGLRPWVYSIAPFVYTRPFEQIRNDICFQRLPVVLVGNGGGYAYGVMGPTHHALEDYGTLTSLPNLRAYVPAFDRDIPWLVDHLFQIDHPAYLRLGVSEVGTEQNPPPFASWRCLQKGSGWVILATGPLAGGIWQATRGLEESRRPTIWLLSEIPILDLPPAFLEDLELSNRLLVIEEHVSQGGIGREVATKLLEQRVSPVRFVCRTALGYPSGRYGSQKFHRQECGLDPASIVALISEID